MLCNVEAVARWKQCKTLIVDEISMLNEDIFEALELIARKVRNCEKRFGCIHLVVCGDFYQLPPVIDLCQYGEAIPTDCNGAFCFKSPVWSVCIDANLKLTKVYRQSDPELLLLLDEVRKGGELSPSAHHILNKLKRREDALITSDADTVFLYPKRIDVGSKNLEILQKLDGEKYSSVAKDTGGIKEKLKKCPDPETLVE